MPTLIVRLLARNSFATNELRWPCSHPIIHRFARSIVEHLMRHTLVIAAFLGLSLLAICSSAQDVIPHHQDQPPGPALSPQDAIRAMTVPEGFSVELVASEPEIVNPVAMTFDERG